MFDKKMIEYRDGNITLEGFYVCNRATRDKRPAVLVVHDWSGKNIFAMHKAEMLAELGYVGFAVDMYGKGKIGNTKEEKVALMQPLMQHRDQLQKRIQAAFDTVSKLDTVDANKIGIIGFCFGGLCALDLARSGANIKGVVSFHGLLTPPDTASHPIKARILALHGFNDPMVTTDQVTAFGNEMTEAKADWQLDIYGNTMHAFTNPEANDPGFGTVYNKSADIKSWQAMKAFFHEVFEG
jgi:dienelactone hydrolase